MHERERIRERSVAEEIILPCERFSSKRACERDEEERGATEARWKKRGRKEEIKERWRGRRRRCDRGSGDSRQ